MCGIWRWAEAPSSGVTLTENSTVIDWTGTRFNDNGSGGSFVVNFGQMAIGGTAENGNASINVDTVIFNGGAGVDTLARKTWQASVLRYRTAHMLSTQLHLLREAPAGEPSLFLASGKAFTTYHGSAFDAKPATSATTPSTTMQRSPSQAGAGWR